MQVLSQADGFSDLGSPLFSCVSVQHCTEPDSELHVAVRRHVYSRSVLLEVAVTNNLGDDVSGVSLHLSTDGSPVPVLSEATLDTLADGETGSLLVLINKPDDALFIATLDATLYFDMEGMGETYPVDPVTFCAQDYIAPQALDPQAYGAQWQQLEASVRDVFSLSEMSSAQQLVQELPDHLHMCPVPPTGKEAKDGSVLLALGGSFLHRCPVLLRGKAVTDTQGKGVRLEVMVKAGTEEICNLVLAGILG
ncbi:coatomer gamma subunit [Kipferlia bialata]|uniref:Coatomer gamma subunit n=1 Tax=Kipferlia bialata TaxID=797122 RepID=A0A9K3CPR9_9EUKA|nr:coatomer gamma subunit [Kipferlia bialata]|eukprot:g817.t1